MIDCVAIIGGNAIEQTLVYKYLSHEIKIGKDKQTHDIQNLR